MRYRRPDARRVGAGAETGRPDSLVELSYHPATVRRYSRRAGAGARTRGNPPPPPGYVVRGLCQGEYCTFGAWTACVTIVARAEPKASAQVAYRLVRNERFEALTGDYHVVQPEIVTFTKPVEVRLLAQPPYVRVPAPADTIYPLVYEGEGIRRWYFQGEVESGLWFLNHLLDEKMKGMVLKRAARTENWVKARNAQGREGWFRRDQRGVTLIGEWRSPNSSVDPKTCAEAESRESRKPLRVSTPRSRT